MLEILAVPYGDPEGDIVARPELVHEPSHTILLIAAGMLVAQDGKRSLAHCGERGAWLRERLRDRAVSIHAVAVRGFIGAGRDLPRTFCTLLNAAKFERQENLPQLDTPS
ncbi:hypothetical protein [Xanthobacter sp. ZOL 2024]